MEQDSGQIQPGKLRSFFGAYLNMIVLYKKGTAERRNATGWDNSD
jgi:hypothetical protein